MRGALEVFAADSLLHEPGAASSYSTFGYVLLGCAIEGAAGVPYLEYMREHVFGPAGMMRTMRDTVAYADPARARGYRRTDSGVAPSRLVDTSFKLAAGGLVSTSLDLVRFARAIVDGSLLSEQSLALMLSPILLADGSPTPYTPGGWQRLPSGPGMVIMAGQQEEVSSLLVVDTQGAGAIALMSNLERHAQALAPLLARIGRILKN